MSTFVVAGVAKANPRIGIVCPCKRKPSYSKRGGKILQVKNFKAFKVLRLANLFPVDLAFGT